jgi:hypothetical protein
MPNFSATSFCIRFRLLRIPLMVSKFTPPSLPFVTHIIYLHFVKVNHFLKLFVSFVHFLQTYMAVDF